MELPTGMPDDAPTTTELASQFELHQQVIEETPFVLSGSVEQVVDKIEHIREMVGITHYVVRDPEGFAPVVAELGDRGQQERQTGRGRLGVLGDELVGRVDLKTDRAERVLRVKAAYAEEGRDPAAVAGALRGALDDLARFVGTDGWAVDGTKGNVTPRLR